MRRPLLTMVAVYVLAFAFPSPSEAQFGGFIDKIQKLSGPRFAGVGASFRFLDNYGQLLGHSDTVRLQSIQGAFQTDLREASTILARFRDSTNAMTLRRADTAALLLKAISDCFDTTEALRRTLPAVRGLNERAIDRLRVRIAKNSLTAPAPRGVPSDIEGMIQALTALKPDVCRYGDLSDDALSNQDDGTGKLIGRVTGFFHYDQDNAERDSLEVFAFTTQLTGELLFRIPALTGPLDFGFETGIGTHFYFGSGVGALMPVVSVPISINYHPFARCASWLLRNFHLGLGVRYFAHRRGALAPAYPSVTGGEWVVLSYARLDFSRGSFEATKRLECD
jgi:hypothetical protein